MTGQELHVPERASGPVNEPCCPRDEGAAPGMRRAAFQADLVERSVEPNHDAQRRHLATALGANDVCRVSRRLGPRSLEPRSLAPRRLAPRRERLGQVGMNGDQPPTALLGGTVAQLNNAADLALRIEHHVHVSAAISPARMPAFADSNTITRLRRGFRVRRAKWRSWFTSVIESIFACLPAAYCVVPGGYHG